MDGREITFQTCLQCKYYRFQNSHDQNWKRCAKIIYLREKCTRQKFIELLKFHHWKKQRLLSIIYYKFQNYWIRLEKYSSIFFQI